MIKENFGVELLQDNRFEKGLAVISPDLSRPDQTGVLDFGIPNCKPVWKLLQWHSHYDIAEQQFKNENGKIIYENTGKKVARFEIEGKTVISLAVYGSHEYAHTRTDNESWMHLMLEQFIVPVKVCDYNHIMLDLDFKLNYCKNLIPEGEYDTAKHCAASTNYFIVRNANRNSEGYDDFIWLGISNFDNRYGLYPGTCMGDEGFYGATNKLIFTASGDKTYGELTDDGKYHHLSVDIIPFIAEAINRGKEMGFVINSQLEDMEVSAFYINWEVPGTFDCELEVKGVSLLGIPKNNG